MPKRYRGRWEWILGEALGEGGQGFAYWATRSEDGTTNWVLKRLRDSVPVDRFEREIEALRLLKSPHIPAVEDYSLEEGQRFYVTEFRGQPLTRLLAENPTTLRQHLDQFRDIAQAIVDAHSVDVAHRDIKPNNVVVDKEGRASLIDFGLSAIVDDELTSLTSQDKYGNEAFAAPECLHGSPVECGLEADIYSLGKLLFWMASEGKYIHREQVRDVVPDLIRDDEYWNRIQVGSLVHAAVQQGQHGRPSAAELLGHVREVCDAIDDRRSKQAAGDIVIWDTLEAQNQFNNRGSRSLTAPPYGNPPDFGELALRFVVPGHAPLVLTEVAVPFTLRAGSGEFVLRLHAETEERLGEAIHEWRLQAGTGIMTFHPLESLMLEPRRPYWISFSVDAGEIAWWAALEETFLGLPVTFSERYGRAGPWPVLKTQVGHACRLVGREAH